MSFLRKIKDKINTISNVIIKSHDIAKDKRLTQRPVFDVYFTEKPGIRHPEIIPTLPLLSYVHNNSPSIKVATMRLRETIFRRGFEWERKFEARCKDCEEEYEDVINKCENCGGTNIEIPDKNEIKRADDFFEKCNIYDHHKSGKRKLLHLLKEIEDDLNIYDDAYIIGIKEYWMDKEGNIKLTSLHQIVRGNPVTMRIVADEFGDPGGKWATCLRHRDVIEDIVDNNIDDLRCRKCGRKLYEVHYVSVEGGGDSPSAYYIGDEIIKVSKYHPGALYGYSPIVTLWQTALTLTNMTEYIYRAYSEAHLPKGVLAMKTSNPDSAYEFWKDVDDKLSKDKHYIPKMFLEGEGNGTGSGMEFVKFMDTLEEMQYIPVRDEIRRTIASIYGVTNIFIGDTAGVGGLNSESTQIDITNMAAESGIAIYNDHIMPEILSWLGIKDWNYVLQSPFEENKQRELNEQLSQVNIAQSMLNMGFSVDLGEEDVFEFKYSGEAKKQEQGRFDQPDMRTPEGGFGENPEQNVPEGGTNQNSEPSMPGMNENTLKMSIQKSRIYIKHPNEAPKGAKIQRSPRGSYYYDKVEQKPVAQPQRPNEQTLNMDKRRRIETLLQQANDHYENILEEYKYSKDINPSHAFSLQDDLEKTRNLIGQLHQNYQELFGDEPQIGKEDGGRNININIQKMEQDFDEIKKYSGEREDIQQTKKFYKELTNIFNIEMSKIMNGAEKFSKIEIQNLINKTLNETILKMEDHTRHHLGLSYREGQQYVAELIGKAINFSKVDESAISAIVNKKVLFDSYKNMSIDLSKKLNEVIEDSFRHPETHSIDNMVRKMQESTSADLYKLSRIARTESHIASQTGRAISFEKFDPNNEFRYKWAIRRDTRTSDVCKAIDTQVEVEGGGKGVTLNRLNDILKENVMKYHPNLEFRPWMCHPNCRSGLVRVFD